MKGSMLLIQIGHPVVLPASIRVLGQTLPGVGSPLSPATSRKSTPLSWFSRSQTPANFSIPCVNSTNRGPATFYL